MQFGPIFNATFNYLVSFRPAIDTLAAAMRRLGTTDFGDEEIGADDIRYTISSSVIFVFQDIEYI